MDLELSGKSVLITGGSRGIGYASASAFVREGARVILVGSTPESVHAAAQELNDKYESLIEAISVDLTNADSLTRLMDRVGTLDVLVNNAGAIPGGGLEDIEDARWRAAWDLKVYGYINITRGALTSMMKRGSGVIVNVIGIAGSAPRYDYLCGSMANIALMNFTRAVGAYATQRSVRVVGVNPGPTKTERLVALYKARALQRFGDDTRWSEMLSHLPFGRPAEPSEMADLIVFLASSRASYLSGVVIDADGGAMYRDA
jgi:3-oxoacyl-[acyl-carrier protein] reductase